MVLVTVWISIYALSGRLILANEKQTADAWTSWTQLSRIRRTGHFHALKVPVADNAGFPRATPRLPICAMNSRFVPTRTEPSSAAHADTPIPASGSEAGDNAEDVNRYLSARQATLCDQRTKLTQRLFIVSTHLQFWSSVIAAPHDETWRFPHYLIWRWFRSDVPSPISPAFLFGVTAGAGGSSSPGRAMARCSIAFESPADRWTADECTRKLWEHTSTGR